jgi:hypothetical protein
VLGEKRMLAKIAGGVAVLFVLATIRMNWTDPHHKVYSSGHFDKIVSPYPALESYDAGEKILEPHPDLITPGGPLYKLERHKWALQTCAHLLQNDDYANYESCLRVSGGD